MRHQREAAAALAGFLGPNKPLRSITAVDGDAFRRHLAAPAPAGRSLGDNTVARRMGRAKQFLTVAVRANPDRAFHLSAEDSARVLAACPPESRWPLTLSLLRWGGLRCLSELRPLTWRDVHWPDPSADNPRDRAGWLRVTSPKTERRPEKGNRTLPLFPEPLDPLRTAYDAAEAGTMEVLPGLPAAPVLRRQFLTILEPASLAPWPRLFHNLRAIRQTELAAEPPMHAVCDWIGNTAAVAAEHYLTTTDANFARAAVSGRVSE